MRKNAVIIANQDNSLVDTQHPFPTNGDSVYQKDIWVEESDSTNWIDEDGTELNPVLIPFTNLHTRIKNETTDNPKSLLIHFNRTVVFDQVGLGCVGTGEDFSNVKVILLGSGGVEREVLDDSANDTKYTSRNYQFSPELANAVKLEFHTTDTICLSNITVQKVTKTASRLQALKPDGVVTDIDATAGGNLKVSLEEIENQISSNANSQLNVTPFHADGTEGNLISGVNYESGKSGIDGMTETLQQISYEHHEIHAGSHYNLCDYALTQAADAEIEFVVTTPNTTNWGHLTFATYSSLGATVEIYEGASSVVGGTAQTPRNNNRNSLNTSDFTIVKDPTSITDGTRAAGFLAGAGRNSGFAERDKENILKQNETYLIRITSLANSNNISWCFEWYEHTNKN